MLTEDILIKKVLHLESLVEQIQAELTQRAYIYAEEQQNRTTFKEMKKVSEDFAYNSL